MRLPGAEKAVVDGTKIRDYLLSESHPVGRFKAPAFKKIGYSIEAWEMLASDLLRLSTENEAVATGSNAYGQKYEVRGTLKGPTGEGLGLATVWIVLNDEDFPRFVTAYPRPIS